MRGTRLSLAERLHEYARLMRIDRPIGTLLLLWPTLWALWLSGDGRPSPSIVAVFVAGVLVMRSAGCVVNDVADRELDRHVTRTRARPLAAGRVGVTEATVLFVVLLAIALGLVLTLNKLTIGLAGAGALLAATYPFTKRVTDVPQVYLGVAFGWGIPMAFAAQTGTVPAIAWVLLLANVLWSVSYDTMYAMVDRADDIRYGSRSTAILFGSADRIWVGVFQAGTLGTLATAGTLASLGPAYYAGLVVAVGFGLYQQYLIRAREPAACFRAFLNNNWLGAAVFGGIWLDAIA